MVERNPVRAVIESTRRLVRDLKTTTSAPSLEPAKPSRRISRRGALAGIAAGLLLVASGKSRPAIAQEDGPQEDVGALRDQVPVVPILPFSDITAEGAGDTDLRDGNARAEAPKDTETSESQQSLIEIIKKRAESIPKPVFAEAYPGKDQSENSTTETDGAVVFQNALAAAQVAGGKFAETARFFERRSRQPNNLISATGSDHASVLYFLAPELETVIDNYPQYAAAKENPISIFELTTSKDGKLRHEFYVFLNGKFKIMQLNDLRLPFVLARIYAAIQQSDLELSRLVRQEKLTDPSALNAQMLSSETQQWVSLRASEFAYNAIKELSASDQARGWYVEANFKKQIQAATGIAFGEGESASQ